MTILAFGTSTSELNPEGNIVASNISATVSASQIAPNVVEGISIKATAQALFPGLQFTPTADVWVSFYAYATLTGAGSLPFCVLSGGGVELFRLYQKTPGALIQYHNGSSWVDSGTIFSQPTNVAIRFDFHVVIHDTTGTLTVYQDGTEQTSTTFAAGDTLLRGEANVDDVRFDNHQPSGTEFFYLSAVIVATVDTRMFIYSQRALDGAGSETDWSGAYTDINESGSDDTDFIQSGVTADKATYTFAALPAAYSVGWDVVGLGVSARASKGATSPANLQLAARHGTTNGFSASKSLSAVFGPHQDIFILNPDTASAWTFAEADAAEVGVQAIT